MHRPSSAVAKYRSQVAGLSLRRTPDDPELIEAKQRLKTELLSEKIQTAVAAFPPLTEDQTNRLVILLKAG